MAPNGQAASRPGAMPPERPIGLFVKPCKTDKSSLSELGSYIRARIKECESRRSICHCLYKDYDVRELDGETLIKVTWGRPSKDTPSEEEITRHKRACNKLYKLLRKDSLTRHPYLTWNNDDLKACLRQRGITIPRPYVKANYVKALMRKDKAHTFRFMDLPMELRYMIYNMALSSTRKNQADPIRQEGSAIFYRINRFFLCYQKDEVLRFDPEYLQWMLDHVGTENLENLRYVTLVAFRPRHKKRFVIDIDLHCRDPRKWIVRKISKNKHICSCKYFVNGESRPILSQSVREDSLSASPELVNASIRTANEAIDKLWETCGDGGKLRLTVAALSDLALVAVKVVKNLNA
ncbi:hypothetical protein D6D17_07471 [Aureobasidium pullulans]|nr:hypothetical protein D6D17_07471 [Aureobasidium pullulans]